MTLQLFKGQTGVGVLKEYSDEDALKLVYAAGWYNNYTISAQYQLNKVINETTETPAYPYAKDVKDGINVNLLNYRSLHTKTINTDDVKGTAYRQVAVSIAENAQFIKTLTAATKVTILLNNKLARTIVNNDDTYATLKIDEHKANGDKIVYLGTIGEYPVYINLMLDEDDTRIFAYGNKEITNPKMYLTSYIKY